MYQSRRRRRRRWGRRVLSRYKRKWGRRHRRNYGFPRRWRRWRRPRTVVTEQHSRRVKTIVVRGWEPMGNVCPTDYAKTKATPYASYDSDQGNGQWHGTWGHHWFTFQSLVDRAEARLNSFSGNWESFDYLRFLGGTMYIMQPREMCFMFGNDPYLMTADLDKTPSQKNRAEETWITPGYLMHRPGTHLILSAQKVHRRSMYKIRVPVPTSWRGWLPIPECFSYVLCHWYWTWWDPDACFFDPCATGSSCEAEPWWSAANMKQSWVDRSQLESSGVITTGLKSWAPFLPTRPCVNYYTHSASFWFKYKLKFQVTGENIWAPVPRDYSQQGTVPTAPARQQVEPKTRTPHKKGLRPPTTADILPGDLDKDGILQDEAYERITRDNPCPKRPKPVGVRWWDGVPGRTLQVQQSSALQRPPPRRKLLRRLRDVLLQL
uniref:Capsid protein n=1 Tax=Torque teno felis virus TaxID=687384 RepID=A0A0D5BU38_9VIRU|nr:ORF1 [Torque teno felis virus]